MKPRRGRASGGARGSTPVAGSPAPFPSRSLALPAWMQHLAALLLLSLAIGAVLPEIAWQGQVFVSPDYQVPSYFADAGRRAMEQGSYPQWNPYIFLGMPSFGSLMFTPYVFPPSEILALLGKLPFVPPLGWLLFYFIAAGYGVFLVLRFLNCGFWPALLGGMAFMLTPHLISMGVFGHGSKLASVAFMPYLIWIALHLVRPGRRLLWTGVLGLFIGLLLLRGHPQIAFYALLTLGILTVVELIGGWRQRVARGELLRFAAGMMAGLVLGLCFSSALLLSIRAYAPHSIRGSSEGGGASYSYATNWSLSPSEVTTFIVPSAVGFGEGTYVGKMPFTNFPHYLGQAVFIFGIAGLVLLRGRFVGFLVSLAVLALFISFGKHLSFVYDLFYNFVPYFNKFRVPVMILVLFQLSTSILAGLGFAALWGREPHGCRWRIQPGAEVSTRLFFATTVTAAVIVLVAFPWSEALAKRVLQSSRIPEVALASYSEVARDLLRGDALRVGILQLCTAAAVLMLWRRRLPPDAVGLLVCALLLVDLAVVDRRMVQPQNTWAGLGSRVAPEQSRELPANAMMDFLREQAAENGVPPRVLPLGSLFMHNEWMSYGISSVGGYHPAKLSRYQAFVADPGFVMRPAIRKLLAVDYIISPERLQTTIEPLYEGPEGVVYANRNSMPRAWLCNRWRQVDREECLQQLESEDFDLEREALLEQACPQPLDEDATGVARIVDFKANRIEIDVNSSGNALLVLSEAYYPSWRASVNGQSQEVLVANCVLRGIPVPAGESRVILTFEDEALRAGIGASSVAGLLILLLVILGVVRARRHPTRAADLGEVSEA